MSEAGTSTSCDEASHLEKKMIATNALLLTLPLLAPDIHQGIPPSLVLSHSEAFGCDLRELHPTEEVRGRAYCDATRRRVTLTFSWMSSISGQLQAGTEAVFATRYWPTDACWVDENTLAVAGKLSSGETVIEKWVFSSVSVSTGSATPSGGGPPVPVYQIDAPERTDVSVAYSAATVGMDMVLAIENSGSNTPEPSVLAQFYDSRDVYLIGLDSGAHLIVASPTAGAAPVVSSSLGEDFTHLRGAEHATLGNLFWFVDARNHVHVDDSAPRPVLLDSNKDGIIDAVLDYTVEQFQQVGLNYKASFTTYLARF